MSDAPFTLFIPFSNGSGYGNPGLTVRAETVDELNALMDDFSLLTDGADPDSASKLDKLLDGVLTVKAAVNLKFPAEEKPARQVAQTTVTPPAGNGKTCAHGEMKYREGVSNSSGKAYKGYFCPAPRGTNQCPPEFIR